MKRDTSLEKYSQRGSERKGEKCIIVIICVGRQEVGRVHNKRRMVRKKLNGVMLAMKAQGWKRI